MGQQQDKRADIQFAIGTVCTHARMDYISEHFVCHIVSGEIRVIESDRQSIYRAGDSFLLRRNTLAKVEHRPIGSGIEFKVMFLVLKKDFLQDYAIRRNLSNIPQTADLKPQVQLLKPSPALTGLFNSLLPYLDAHSNPSAMISAHKLEEMLICLQELDSELITSLLTVAVTDRLDLTEFMERNYMFNVPLAKFSELSGRSLSTFQRDFKKVFHTQAAHWLLKRRLKAAHDLLMNSGRKPNDVYLETGFEDLAHFSKSFKKEFGYNPSKVGTGGIQDHLGSN
jgi:AraC-like DNA-binding protein